MPLPKRLSSSHIPLSLQVILAFVLGGCLAPFYHGNSVFFSQLSQTLIQLVKGVAIPFLFFSILLSVSETQIARRQGVKLLGITAINSTLAFSWSVLLVQFSGVGLKLKDLLNLVLAQTPQTALSDNNLMSFAGKKIEFGKTILSYIPTQVLQPFLELSVIPIVLLAIAIGSAIRLLPSNQNTETPEHSRLVPVLHELKSITEILLKWAVHLMPIAVFCSAFYSVSKYTLQPLTSLGWLVVLCLTGFGLQIGVTYHAWLMFLGISPRQFWREARKPFFFSLGTNSSMVSLPLTLKALDKLGISRKASTLGACIGTNLNNDGILLYEVLIVFLIYQSQGLTLGLPEAALIAVSCWIGAVGVAGVPEAGIIALTLVLSTVGLPLELVPVLLSVDWILARARSGVNVLADMTVSIALDRTSAPGGPSFLRRV